MAKIEIMMMQDFSVGSWIEHKLCAVLVAFYDKRTAFVGLAPTLKTQKREKGNAHRT